MGADREDKEPQGKDVRMCAERHEVSELSLPVPRSGRRRTF